jgi:hypothetical protein
MELHGVFSRLEGLTLCLPFVVFLFFIIAVWLSLDVPSLLFSFLSLLFKGRQGKRGRGSRTLLSLSLVFPRVRVCSVGGWHSSVSVLV